MMGITFILAFICLFYGLGCAVIGTVWVGSKSYHGRTVRYTRKENPGLFWFWCAFFIVLGVLCMVGASMGDQ